MARFFRFWISLSNILPQKILKVKNVELLGQCELEAGMVLSRIFDVIAQLLGIGVKVKDLWGQSGILVPYEVESLFLNPKLTVLFFEHYSRLKIRPLSTENLNQIRAPSKHCQKAARDNE
jgi:hypothetical protein